ncbi:MAG TPA: chromosome segregation protein SMC [Methylovirgula sp.]|nr:chromosome segregation protein SMC [Methylovirgula sp.]
MKFTRLHLAGFKTFVEPTDFVIERGLTGVVGPNGCGKSNLVDAMRWVMGENSSKNMRGSDMDDVIFAGSGNRPARNMAEVRLALDNADRTAPAAFNDTEHLEVSRHIERGEGSTYRVNGRETRARDVQLLFADAATGSRSAAIVRQGTIGEIISVKPQARRRILEEAAGVAGLHARRHEAELRLKGAEENLVRLEDVLKQIETQTDSLKRQARQAVRYRNVASEIRRLTALHALVNHRESTQALANAEQKLEADLLRLAEETKQQAETTRLQAIAAHELIPLREAEQTTGAALQKLVLARETLDGEEKRAKNRLAELERRLAQLNADHAREQALIEDAASVLARLDAEATELTDLGANDAETEQQAREALAAAEAALAISDKALGEAQTAVSHSAAQRAALAKNLNEEAQRLARFETELKQVRANLDALKAELDTGGAETDLQGGLDQAITSVAEAETRVMAAEAAHVEARDAEGRIRAPLLAAERAAQQLETEASTLSKLLTVPSTGAWTAVVEEITVAKGYEAALGAALGDDLEAPTDAAAPAHWALTSAEGDPALPDGAEALTKYVTAPPALIRRLAQIGVIDKIQGTELRSLLKPGQRLVSKEGDLWRWDGFTQAEEAPTPAARRLAEKNRLGDLLQEAATARAAADALKTEADQIGADLKAKAAAESEARQAHRELQRSVEAARERLAAFERKKAQSAARLSALEEAEQRLAASSDEARGKHEKAEADIRDLADTAELSHRLDAARAAAAQDRAAATEARAGLQTHLHESETRTKRRNAIAEERKSWAARRERATSQIDEFQSRLAETAGEHEKMAEAPNEFIQTRRALMNEIETAEAARRSASDARAAAEQRLVEADRAARNALEGMSTAREDKARSEARLEAAREHLTEVAHHIVTELQCAPEELAPLAEVDLDEELPASGEIETKLESLKADRERLGAVNLRADEELTEVETSRTSLVTEREDLTEAIRRLRQAIQNLNKEGRERLVAAFDVVNGHFKELFTILFNGGTAELQLIESDDPLEAGLEVLARPPGKKPQVMTLLSGGEQALVAMSLIFAVFLTNPSPICVLDEVDAPLDDANVERFCDLLDAMAKRTETRFVTITHNPITMARMDRLFGVTMAEQGVSQLVSVDLADAEKLREAV